MPSRIKEPADRESFSWVLWKILGGNDAHLAKAAQLLGIKTNYLGGILRDRRNITRRYIEARNWREILRTGYKTEWRKWENEFERRAARLSPAKRGSIKEPEDKNGFGWIVWKVLGAKDAYVKEAAARLDIDHTYLSNIIHGHKPVSKAYIEAKNWRGTFARFYAESWSEYEHEFERRAALLSIPAPKGTDEPENKDSLAWILWTILGGRHFDRDAAAVRLGTHKSFLGDVIRGHLLVSQGYIKRKNWRQAFSRHYPSTWMQYWTQFESIVNGLPTVKELRRAERTRKIPQPLLAEKSWRQAAGAILKRIRTNKGDDIPDITSCMNNPDVRSNYQRLEEGAPTLPAALFRTAAEEIRQIYYMKPSDPNLARLRKILDNAQRLDI